VVAAQQARNVDGVFPVPRHNNKRPSAVMRTPVAGSRRSSASEAADTNRSAPRIAVYRTISRRPALFSAVDQAGSAGLISQGPHRLSKKLSPGANAHRHPGHFFK